MSQRHLNRTDLERCPRLGLLFFFLSESILHARLDRDSRRSSSKSNPVRSRLYSSESADSTVGRLSPGWISMHGKRRRADSYSLRAGTGSKAPDSPHVRDGCGHIKRRVWVGNSCRALRTKRDAFRSPIKSLSLSREHPTRKLLDRMDVQHRPTPVSALLNNRPHLRVPHSLPQSPTPSPHAPHHDLTNLCDSTNLMGP